MKLISVQIGVKGIIKKSPENDATTFSTMTLGIITLSMMTFRMITFSMVAFSIKNTQQVASCVFSFF
jgi:hypothetical protein